MTSSLRVYQIRRFRYGKGGRWLSKPLMTEAEAQAWCSREDTKGPGWFDGYDLSPSLPAKLCKQLRGEDR